MKKRLFILLQYLLPQHFLSRTLGGIAESQMPAGLLQRLLRAFVKKFKVDMSLAAHPDLSHYKTFNEFFIRRLKLGARPIEAGIVSPADGTISQLGKIHEHAILQAKGIDYSVQQLLANNSELTRIFTNGSFNTIYLSPRDYHRVHLPYGGKLLKAIYVPGKLFSVNPTTVENVQGVFARNERLITIFHTDRGLMAVILVGAMLVAGIRASWPGADLPKRTDHIEEWDYQDAKIEMKKGDELGYFNFGSTVIVLFQENKANWLPTFQPQSAVILGQTLAE